MKNEIFFLNKSGSPQSCESFFTFSPTKPSNKWQEVGETVQMPQNLTTWKSAEGLELQM